MNESVGELKDKYVQKMCSIYIESNNEINRAKVQRLGGAKCNVLKLEKDNVVDMKDSNNAKKIETVMKRNELNNAKEIESTVSNNVDEMNLSDDDSTLRMNETSDSDDSSVSSLISDYGSVQVII